jgi:hypothetical protein
MPSALMPRPMTAWLFDIFKCVFLATGCKQKSATASWKIVWILIILLLFMDPAFSKLCRASRTLVQGSSEIEKDRRIAIFATFLVHHAVNSIDCFPWHSQIGIAAVSMTFE